MAAVTIPRADCDAPARVRARGRLSRAASDFSLWARKSAEDVQQSARAAAAARAEARADARAAAAPPPPTSSGTRIPLPPPPPTPEQRVTRFKRLLQAKPMPLDRLRHAVFVEGVPDDGGDTASLRAITWKLLLSYLPADRAQWQASLADTRQSYRQFCDELIVNPHEGDGGDGSGGGGGGGGGDEAGGGGGDGDGGGSGYAESEAVGGATSGGAMSEEVTSEEVDHPLTASVGSKWVEWHADENLRAEIRKDVDRTLPDYAFFSCELPMGRVHHAAISRILFIYAKLNPGIRYVQGMNEVLAPIYYVFCQEIDEAAYQPSNPLAPIAPRPAADAADAADAAGGAAAETSSPSPSSSAGGASADPLGASADALGASADPLGASADPLGASASSAAEPGAVACDVSDACSGGSAGRQVGSAAVGLEGENYRGETEGPPAELEAVLEAVEADAFFCFTNLMAEVSRATPRTYVAARRECRHTRVTARRECPHSCEWRAAPLPPACMQV